MLFRSDADMLFRNLADIKELEADVSYLSPVQLKIIAFWANFTDETSLSEEKRRFLAVWQTLGPVYRTFRERLRSLGMAYTGMVHRAAAERIKAGGFAFPESRRFVVAGLTRSRSARNGFSSFSPRLPKPISTGITILIIRTMPTRRPVCSCVRTGSCFPPGANFRTIISGRRSESKRFLRYRTPCNAST